MKIQKVSLYKIILKYNILFIIFNHNYQNNILNQWISINLDYINCKQNFVNSGLRNAEIILVENLIDTINNF